MFGVWPRLDLGLLASGLDWIWELWFLIIDCILDCWRLAWIGFLSFGVWTRMDLFCMFGVRSWLEFWFCGRRVMDWTLPQPQRLQPLDHVTSTTWSASSGRTTRGVTGEALAPLHTHLSQLQLARAAAKGSPRAREPQQLESRLYASA